MAHSEIQDQDEAGADTEGLPFVAPCRTLTPGAPLQWLTLGWRDFQHAPGVSLLYGGFMVALCYALAFLAWKLGGYVFILGMVSGFVFIAPVLALGLYSISCQLQRGLQPRIGHCLREGRRHLGNELVYSVILLVIFLLWVRAASVVHVFFPMEADPDIGDLALFLLVGCAVGALFSALVFAASAFSLPMMLDRRADTVTAVLTSVHAVLHNKGPMLVWALMIGLALLASALTAFLVLAVLLPVLGYATWHGYHATIQADVWPRHGGMPPDAT